MGKAKEEDLQNPNEGFLYQLMDRHMWIFTIFLVPISLFYDLYFKIYLMFSLWKDRNKAFLDHDKKVEDVQQQVRQWIADGSKVPMCTARPGWKSISIQVLHYKDRLHKIRVDMPDILFVDEKKRFVRVEPMVSIGQLNDYLIEKGWTLPVVPELDDLTIGGLVMGGGIESTSHKYGLFQYICRQFEMVLADGSRLWVSPENEPELFSAIPFSYGTLGFLVGVDVDIIPYKPFIKLDYHPVHTLDEVVDVFTCMTNNPKVDSVEGIMYSLNEGVMMSGVFVDSCPEPAKLNSMGRWYKPWFYKHVETFLHNKEPDYEYIPTVDFFHRHNRSYFWMMQYIMPFANNPVFRYLLGWTMPPKFSFLKLMRQKIVPKEQNYKYVIQDFGFKLETLKEALHFCDEQTRVYPIWLCPTRHCVHKGLEKYSMFHIEDIHVDVGLYGESQLKKFDPVESQRRLERWAIDHEAYVAPYAETQLTLEEYYEMFSFNLRIYEKVRKQLKCEKAFPHIYEKISKLGRS